MVISFLQQEEDYEKWCTENKDSYVFNHAGGATGNVLHRVSCWHLNVSSRKGTYTKTYRKYCSNDLEVLIEKAEQVSSSFPWRKCKSCF